MRTSTNAKTFKTIQHEAAHAVIASTLGIRVHTISLKQGDHPSGRRLGGCLFGDSKTTLAHFIRATAAGYAFDSLGISPQNSAAIQAALYDSYGDLQIVHEALCRVAQHNQVPPPTLVQSLNDFKLAASAVRPLFAVPAISLRHQALVTVLTERHARNKLWTRWRTIGKALA